MLRRLALLVLILVPAPVVLAGVALAVLQTGPGRALVETAVSRLSRDTGTSVALTGLSGGLPLRPRIARIEIADAAGVWLRVEGARLDLDGTSLLRLRPVARVVAAERIEVLRLPEGPPTDGPSEPVDLGVLLRLPPVSVERLELPEIVIDTAVIGEELRLAADGSLAIGGERGAARARLDLRRLTETTTRATLELLVEPERDAARVALDVRDDSGLLGRVLDRPVGRTTARLDGSGPLDRWTGALVARAEGLLSAELALEVSSREPLRLRLDGTVEPADGLVPAAAAAVIGPRVRLAAEAGLAADGAWSVRELAIETAQLRLAGALSGSAAQAATGRLQLSAPRLETAEAAVDDLRAELTVEPAATPGGWTIGIDATSRPRRAAGQELAALGEVRLAATAVLQAAGAGEVRIARLATALGSVTGEARFRPGLAGLTARARAEIPDLRALAALPGQSVTWPAGAARLTLVGERSEADGSADVHARLELSGLDGLPEPAAALIGGAPGLDLSARIAPGGRMAPIRANVDLEHGTLLATGSVDAGTAEADLLLTGDLPDLAPLGTGLGTALGGSVRLEASVRGRLEQPALTARIEARDLVADGQRVERLDVRLEDVAVAPVPESRIMIRASRGDAPLELGTILRLDGPSLTARDLQVTGPGLSLAGEASVDTATGLAAGQIRGTVADLARLRPWHEQALGGAAELDLTASAEGGKQGLRLRLVGRDLAVAGTSLRRAELSGSAADLAGAATLDLTLDLDGLRSGEARLDSTRLTLQGPAHTPRYRLELQGNASGPLQVTGGGDLALADPGVRIGIADLRARWRDSDVAQTGRATVAAGAAEWSVQGLALQSGPARLVADLAVSPASARGSVRLRDLPAAMLAAAGAPPLEGTIAAEIDVAGTGAEPRLRFALRADALVYVGAAGEEVPPVDLNLEGTLAGGRLESTATVSGLAEKPVSASATLPVLLTLAPFQAVLDQSRPLRARLVLDGEVSRLVPRHLLDERRLTGAMRGELRLGGTLAAPRFAGSLRLDGGAYDDAVTGTTLRDITLEVTGREREIVVERLTANDGAGGTLDADARVLVDDRFELPWQAQLRIGQLRALRNDLIEATLTGRIDATGSRSRAELRGRIEVERAEVEVPSRFAGSIPVIAVQDSTEPAAGPPPPTPVAFSSTLAIDVVAPGQVFVRGRGIESEWQADLQVRGAIDAPRVTGAIALRRGQFDFLGRRLQLTRGIIGFSGATPPDPTLDIRGESSAAEVTAIVEIGGVVSKPQITLSSEPALPQDEVLARLLFGRDTSRISATQGLQIATALRELTGLSSGPGVIDRLRSGIGLDTLDFSTEAGETGVRAGRYLSDEVYVEVQRGVEPGTGKATVEIELTPNLRVQSEVTDRATSGVGLQWRMDY